MFPDAMLDDTRTVTVDYVQPRLKPRLNSIYAGGVGPCNDLSINRRHSETISAQLFAEDSVNLLDCFKQWNIGKDSHSLEPSPSLLLAILNFNFRLNK